MRLRGNGLGRGVGGAAPAAAVPAVTPPNDTVAAAAVCVAGVGDLQLLAALNADLTGAGLLPCGFCAAAVGSVATVAKQLDKAFTVLGLGSSSAFTMVTGGAHITTSGGGRSGSALKARLGGGVGGFAGTFSVGSCRELKISTRPLMLNCCGVVGVCGDRTALGDMGGLPSGRGICVGAGGVGVCLG